MTRVTDWVLAHRRTTVVFWLLVAIAGGALASTTVGRLTYDFDLPGQPAFETNSRIVQEFGNGGLNDPLLVVARGNDAARTSVDAARTVEQQVPGTRVVTADDSGAGALTSSDGRYSVAVLYPPVTPGPEPYEASQQRIEAIVGAPGNAVLTGFTLLSEGGGEGDRGVLVEIVFGAAGALVVLALVFASLLAGLPLLVAAVSILGTFLALLGLTTLTDVSFVVQFLVGLIGLGVAIDYSLLIVSRWREEIAHGHDNDDAVRIAMRTAGRSVMFSGVTVAVSLAALVLVPLPFLRSIGLGGLLIPLFSVATSVTLVPAILSAVGPRLLWPHRRTVRSRSRLWEAIARRVLAHRWVTIVGCLVVLGLLAAPVASLTLGSPQLTGLASTSPVSTATTEAVDAGIPTGVLRPLEVLAPTSELDGLADELRGVGGIAAVAQPDAPAWQRDGRGLLQVWTADDPASDAGRSAVAEVRSAAGRVPDTAVGGSPPEDADFVSAVYDNVVIVLIAVVIVTFLLLARALRSLWLPVKALVLIVISIAAAYGITVLIWQQGVGSDLIFGRPATGVITTWVPIAAFAFLFGLSMDYEVFILARMREAYDEHGDTDRAVVDGIAHTGRLVTSAALILFLAFVALSTVPTVDVKVLATALALGIVIDAVIVRGLLAPALVGVLGRLNWTIPTTLAKLRRA